MSNSVPFLNVPPTSSKPFQLVTSFQNAIKMRNMNEDAKDDAILKRPIEWVPE